MSLIAHPARGKSSKVSRKARKKWLDCDVAWSNYPVFKGAAAL